MTSGTVITLPARVTATLAHVDSPDGWHSYRLTDARGYTHRSDTIRVTWGGRVAGRANTYIVEAWRRDGWVSLCLGVAGNRFLGQDAGVHAAVSILFGMEDHG